MLFILEVIFVSYSQLALGVLLVFVIFLSG